MLQRFAEFLESSHNASIDGVLVDMDAIVTNMVHVRVGRPDRTESDCVALVAEKEL